MEKQPSEGRALILFNQDWHEDCMRWRGRVLTGLFAHWCYDWDGLPVDETTYEFGCCYCFRESRP